MLDKVEESLFNKLNITNCAMNFKPDDACKIFVGGLSWDTTRENLYGYFIQFGEIADCVLMYDPQTQRSRGFGFVTFIKPLSVIDVLTHGEHILDNKLIDPKAAVPRGPLPILNNNKANKSTKIFVGGIGQCKEEDLLKYFSHFGQVTDVTIMMDKLTGRPRGFAFVGFTYYYSVETTSSIRFHNVNGKTVEVKKAQPREIKIENSCSQSVSSGDSPIGMFERKSSVDSCSQQHFNAIKSNKFSQESWIEDYFRIKNKATSLGDFSSEFNGKKSFYDDLLSFKSISSHNLRLYEKSKNHSCRSNDNINDDLSEITRKGITDLLTDIWR